jgi:glucose-1-phosphate adenylyltransferase
MHADDLSRSLELPKRTLALVLAGGRGSRLKNLTDRRAKPSVYFGGKFRIIDFALSNCINSGIRRIGVITQYQSHSLLRHLQRGWAFLNSQMNEFIDLMPAQQRQSDENWYRGTAHAVYQNLDIIEHHNPEYIVVLAGDHVYKMNYALMVADHVASGRDCTVGCIEVPRSQASEFGVMAIDEQRNIMEFIEKPEDPPAMPGRPDTSLASMGIYVFNAKWLYDALKRDIANRDSVHDFGRDLIPMAVREGVAFAHPFNLSCVGSRQDEEPYWRDVGTVDAYWDANIDLTATQPKLNLYDADWPIWTYQLQLPPAKFVHDAGDRCGHAIESLVSGGCIVSGLVKRSVLYSNTRIHSYAQVHESVLLPEAQVGRGARLHKVIVDRRCHIPEGMVIGEDPAADARRFHRSEGGVVLVTQDMLDKLKQAASLEPSASTPVHRSRRSTDAVATHQEAQDTAMMAG